MNVVFIGAGKLATHLAKELYKYSFKIIQVYSRTIDSANLLASQVDAKATNSIKEIRSDADIYIFSVKDSVLPALLDEVPSNDGLWLHTAGSIPMSVFENYSRKFGVIYPFQTFSKDKDIDFKNIPIFIEVNNNDDLQLLQTISNQLSDKVYHLSSEKRQYLHLTGIFACNFVNHMYTLSEDILDKANIPFDVLLPLIDETASKVHSLKPKDAQTGPAMRYDKNIINKHLSLLEDPDIRNIYKSISENIHKINTEK